MGACKFWRRGLFAAGALFFAVAAGTAGKAADGDSSAPATLAPAKNAKTAMTAKAVIGRLETVAIKEAGITVTGKIDTGTQSSSLAASDIAIFRGKGRDMVRFTIRDGDGRPITLERPLLRVAKFKDNARQAPLRPIVTLGLCVGTLYRRTQVNLADRGNFTFPLLLGRRFLFGHAIVDTAKKFTAQPACDEIAPR